MSKYTGWLILGGAVFLAILISSLAAVVLWLGGAADRVEDVPPRRRKRLRERERAAEASTDSAMTAGSAVTASSGPANETGETASPDSGNGGVSSSGPEDSGGGEPDPDRPIQFAIGKLHNIGNRPTQQDSLAVRKVSGGIFAVVSDGMGGLEDGDKASQAAVYSMLQDASGHTAREIGELLLPMLSHANGEVTRLLQKGQSQPPAAPGIEEEPQYRGGATMVAVAAEEAGFRWISVGDSRVYLFRNGLLLQLNREHIYEEDLLRQAVNREGGFQEVRRDPQRRGLTSFLGMGELRYIDHSPRMVPAQRGDRLLLLTDGVFHSIPDAKICELLCAHPEADAAAEYLGAAVLNASNPRQDNFTAILVDYL